MVDEIKIDGELTNLLLNFNEIGMAKFEAMRNEFVVLGCYLPMKS